MKAINDFMPGKVIGNSHLPGIRDTYRTVRTWLGSAAVLNASICAISGWLIFQLL
ncbi:MAG: hypothetical protein ACR2O3_10070 [Rhizobiaceae bacterium]